MLHPNQFQVNEVWIAVKANKKPIELTEGSFNTFTVMDAASTFVIGHAIVPSNEESPPKDTVVSIFRKAWEQKQAWPKKLIIPDSHTDKNTFKIVAEERGIAVENAPIQMLLPIIQPMQESFTESFRRR